MPYKNPEDKRAWRRKDRESNPEKHAEYNRYYRLLNPGRHKERNALKSPEQKAREKQAELAKERARKEALADRPRPLLCEIPGCTRPVQAWDHCHKTGLFRAWLCSNHNSAIGMCNDDPVEMQNVALFMIEQQLRVFKSMLDYVEQRQKEDAELEFGLA